MRYSYSKEYTYEITVEVQDTKKNRISNISLGHAFGEDKDSNRWIESNFFQSDSSNIFILTESLKGGLPKKEEYHHISIMTPTILHSHIYEIDPFQIQPVIKDNKSFYIKKILVTLSDDQLVKLYNQTEKEKNLLKK